jgi:hypothetical protein
MDYGDIRMSYYEAGSGELIVERGFPNVAAAKSEGARRVALGKVDLNGFGILIDEDAPLFYPVTIEGDRA